MEFLEDKEWWHKFNGYLLKLYNLSLLILLKNFGTGANGKSASRWAICGGIFYILLVGQPIWGSTEGEKKAESLVSPEFDGAAWERLSLEEKERNVLWKNKNHPDHCDPIIEYKEALQFFRKEKGDINPSEARARSLAFEISKGCLGGAKRFIKVCLLLKRSGVDHSRAIEYAVEFAKSDDETVENFFELFKKTYLGEYFDLDYTTALKISFELSKLFKGNRKQARLDFLEISQFCTSKDGMNLPVSKCAEISVIMTRLSQYYPDGIRSDFLKLYKALREDRRFGVSILTAVRIMNEVLPYGPTAPQTFLKSYEFAIDPSGLASGGMSAVKFAVQMAKGAVKKWPPPIYTPPKFPTPNPDIHSGYVMASEYKADGESNTLKMIANRLGLHE